MALDHLLIVGKPSDCGGRDVDKHWEQALGYCRTRTERLGTIGDSASYYPEMLGVSGENASYGLICMLGFALEVVAC